MLATIKQLPRPCQRDVLLRDDELVGRDPEAHERCGLLDDRFEVYALRIEQWRRHLFVVSLDRRGGGRLCPAMRHAVVPASNAGDRARWLVTRHRALRNPSWEV